MPGKQILLRMEEQLGTSRNPEFGVKKRKHNTGSASDAMRSPTPRPTLDHDDSNQSVSSLREMVDVTTNNSKPKESQPLQVVASGGLLSTIRNDRRVGIYLPDARKARIAKFHSKRKMRIWRKRIKYDVRKKLADSRPRVKGRFVKQTTLVAEEEDEDETML